MIYKVKIKELSKYIEDWSTGLLNNDRDLLYAYDNGKYIGVDNTTDNCWVEEFKTEKEVINWLKESFDK